MDIKEDGPKFFSSLFSFTDAMDVKFVFPDHQKLEIQAHKLVLALSSPVFHAMFYGGLKEEGPVSVKDVDPDIFQKMIYFMYFQEFKIVDIEEATALQAVADKYDLPKLLMKVENFFLSIVTAENCCEIYDTMIAMKFSNAKAKCEELFEKNTKQVTESSSFLHCGPNTINKICCLTKIMNTTELDLYKAIEKWIRVQTADGEAEEEHVKKIQVAFQNIRFLTIDAAEICKMKLLSLEDRNAIVYRKLRPSSTDLPFPVGFSTINSSRTG